MVFLEHRPHVYNALTTVVEATALLFVQHAKGAIIVNHVTPPHGKNGRSIPDDCERTATVALTDCQTGVLVDNHSSFAALDGLSTVFEPPFYRSKNGHTHQNPDTNDHTTSLCYAHAR